MENEHERRACRRFEMKLPATVIYPSADVNGNTHHLMLTRDISHTGAYFNMMKPFFYTGPVQVEVLLEVAGDCSKCMYIYMMAGGEVVRCDATGLAVIFNEDFMLAPFHLQ